MADIYFSIGSNQGDRSANLNAVCKLLQEKVGALANASAIYESEPWGYNDETPYLNQVLHCTTELSPTELLKECTDIEKSMGRQRSGKPGYEARIMDIDILFYDHLEISVPALNIPHPRLHLRNFVLIPLNEIASDFVHPSFRLTIKDLLYDCNDKSKVAPLS
ncbi:MAG: 2-amino-4-hydroxy-6-hydroxymethyldihydropteridine diphosphokinase [Patiriisocius sp.]|jgi:2-amino-4-hydroxy-6-hydroxymethyldihydropteridine diphosphokinase